MDFGSSGVLKPEEMIYLGITAVVAAVSSFAVFLVCLAWFRREQRRLQKRLLNSITHEGMESGELFLTGRDASACGELVAQFKVNHGKQVVSVLESDGKRFVHIDGDLTAPQRARMFRYLKSEGFMS